MGSEAVRVDLSPSSGDLLKLRKDDVVYVQTQSGPVRMRLLVRAWIEPVGKPGVRRVRFDVVDVEHAESLDRWEARQGPHYRGRGIFSRNPARHTVSGDRIRGVERSS